MAATKTKASPTKSKPAAKKPSPKAKQTSKSPAKPKSDDKVAKAIKSIRAQAAEVPELRKVLRDNQNDLDEVAVPDIQKFLRDNPSLRVVDNSRRSLPVEEFDAGSPERKAREKALKVIDKAVDVLSEVGEDIQGLDPVLDAKIKDARRTLLS